VRKINKINKCVTIDGAPSMLSKAVTPSLKFKFFQFTVHQSQFTGFITVHSSPITVH